MSLNFERLEEELRACGKYKVLQNDVTLVYEDRPGTGLVQGEITICSGSHHVHPFATMHLLEHMLFNGTLTISTPQEVDLRALQYGLLLNATTYGQQVVIPISGENETPLLQSNFIPAFSHVLDIVYHPLLTAESFLKEQIIIRREEKEDEPNPANKLLYPNNPVLWTPRSLEKVTLEQVRRLHQETFVGANTIVTLLGDINGDITHRLETAIEGDLSNILKGNRTRSVEYKSELPFKKEKINCLGNPSQKDEVTVSIYYQIPNPEKDEQALQMMCRVLTGSVVSILMDRLREQTKYTYHVDARLESLHDKTGYLVIEYKIQYSNLAQSIQEVSNGIATLLSGNFDDRLYEGMRAVMLPQFLQAYSQPGWMIEELLSRRMYKKEPFQEAKRALAVTKRSIIDVANSYLTGKRLFVVN